MDHNPRVYRTRHVARKSLFGTKVVLQVQDTLVPSDKWRDATPDDLAQINEHEKSLNSRNSSDLRFFIGQRVKATRSSFNRGCIATVVFQEPSGGKVWAKRDGTSGPCWFWADELDPIWTAAAHCTKCGHTYVVDPILTGNYGQTNKVYVSCQNKECEDYDSGIVTTVEDAVALYMKPDGRSITTALNSQDAACGPAAS